MSEFPENKGDELPTWTEITDNFFDDYTSEDTETVEALHEAAHKSLELADDELGGEVSEVKIEALAKKGYLEFLEDKATQSLAEKLGISL
jgi:hypothetical protein